MKLVTNVNRSNITSGPGPDPSPVSDASGLKIAPRQSGVYDYEAFLVVKGPNPAGVGSLIDPEDYFDPNKSKDVYALLCARPESETPAGFPMPLNVYPIFFIAHVAGMSDPFSVPEVAGPCRTVCLDVVQRVGVGDTLAGMQSRIYMNLRVRSSSDLAEVPAFLFRPSWDRFLSSPDASLTYESEACPVEWSITQDNALDLTVKDKNGGNLHSWLYTCWLHPAGAVRVSPGDISVQNNWAVWGWRFGSVDRDQFFPIADFAATMSFPFAKLTQAEKPFIQNTVWMCWMSAFHGEQAVLPMAHVPGSDKWGDLEDSGMSVLFPVVRGL